MLAVLLAILSLGLFSSALYWISRAPDGPSIREAVVNTIAEGVLLAEEAKARADSIGARDDPYD